MDFVGGVGSMVVALRAKAVFCVKSRRTLWIAEEKQGG